MGRTDARDGFRKRIPEELIRPPPFPQRILADMLVWPSLRGGIISATPFRGLLILYCRNGVNNYPAIFIGPKNYPAPGECLR